MIYQYEDIREQIRTGDLFFTAGNSFFSRSIRFFTRSKVSHAGLFVWAKITGKKRLLIVEVIEGVGFHMEYASQRFEREPRAFWARLHDAKTPEYVEERINEASGTEYDMRGALLSIFTSTERKNALFCSKFAAFCHGSKNIANYRGITPDDLANRSEFLRMFATTGEPV